MGGQCAGGQPRDPNLCRAGARYDPELCGKLGQDELSERCAENSRDAHNVRDGGCEVDHEFHHRFSCFHLHSLVEGYLPGAGEEDGRRGVQALGCQPPAGSGLQYQPDFLRLHHRQDHRLGNYRRFVLHLHDTYEDAVHRADCDDRRRDERHPGLRPLYRSRAERAHHTAGRAAAGVLLHHFHHRFAAGGRQCHRPQDSRQYRRYFGLLGAHFDHRCGGHFRLRGDAPRRAGVRGHLSDHQRYCELLAAQKAENDRHGRLLRYP